MKLPKAWLRSAGGQLSLLAVVYLGALVLAGLAILLRDVFFERYVREKYPPLTGQVERLARDLAIGRAGADDVRAMADKLAVQPARGVHDPQAARQAALDQLVSSLYGTWVSDPAIDQKNLLRICLLSDFSGTTIQRVRITLAVGNAFQRRRAVEFLTAPPAHVDSSEVMGLLRYAAQRAERRGESDLAALANAALGKRP